MIHPIQRRGRGLRLLACVLVAAGLAVPAANAQAATTTANATTAATPSKPKPKLTQKQKPKQQTKKKPKQKATQKATQKTRPSSVSGKTQGQASAAHITYNSPSTTQQATGAEAAAPALATGQLPNNAKPALHPESSCFTALGSSNAARRLSAKVPFFADGLPTPAVLGNQSRPSKLEKSELTSVIAGYEMCLDMSSAWRQETYSPEARKLLDAYWQQTRGLLGALAAGKSSYGEAARAVAENDQAYKSRLDAMATPQ